MRFTYALNTSTIRECGLSVEEEVRLAAAAGYDGIELWVAQIEAYVEAGGTLESLKALLDEHNLRVPNLIAFFRWASPDEAERQQGLADAEAVFRMAKALGCPYVAAPPYGIADRSDIPLADLAPRYSDLLAVGRKVGVEPLLEFWRHSKILGSLHEALDLLAAVGDPNAAMLGDVFHMSKVAGSYDLMRQIRKGQLGLFHVNDFPGSPDVQTLTDADRVYPGDGVAPFDKIIAALKEIEFDGMLSLELFNAEYQKEGAEAVVRTGLEKTRRVFEGG